MKNDQTLSMERADQGRARSGALDATLARLLLQGLAGAPIGVVLWDGARFAAGPGRPVAWIWLKDRSALTRLLLDPDLQFGELYSAGRLEVDGSLVDLAEAVYRVDFTSIGRGPVARLLRRLDRPRDNGERRSRENIHHHYDIGNDFYRLWLDEQLVYTCAYFPDPSDSLEDAQIAKMEHVCRKLDLKPGERVVEAGCGWGALALHMARHHGVRVRAYNISRSQVAHARERAEREGLADRVEFVDGDYREIAREQPGSCDVFVSVGMLEHVGPGHYQDLGRVIDRVLSPAGRGLIHSIGTPIRAPVNPWIERHIFPGGYTPTLREMMAVFEPFRLSILDVENLRLHYAKTLEHWLGRFEAHQETVRALFDEPFVRAWRLYLSGSTAAFRSGALDLFQVLFNRTGTNDVAWTRAPLYRPRGGEGL